EACLRRILTHAMLDSWRMVQSGWWRTLTSNLEITLAEGLRLDGVPADYVRSNCLPLKLVGSEASPIL
ncbi:hypothetical protein RYX36_016064, partial [Vicia faba]